MSPETGYETPRIDNLGIVTGIIREIDLVEAIDEKLALTGKKVICDERVLSMMLNLRPFGINMENKNIYLPGITIHERVG